MIQISNLKACMGIEAQGMERYYALPFRWSEHKSLMPSPRLEEAVDQCQSDRHSDLLNRN